MRVGIYGVVLTDETNGEIGTIVQDVTGLAAFLAE
jgi:hypothetical protein